VKAMVHTRGVSPEGSVPTRRCSTRTLLELEFLDCDPKDSELCLHRLKPEEILVEDRRVVDVQITRQMQV